MNDGMARFRAWKAERHCTGDALNGVPELWSSIVDVRDMATAHIKAGFTPEARGRHIVVSGEARLFDIANILRKHFGVGYPFPRREAPKIPFWLVAPMYGHTRKFVTRNEGFMRFSMKQCF